MTKSGGTQNEGIGLSRAQHRRCAQVARLYYESELTQQEIADMLGLSRMKVNRLLSLGRRAGVVEITINAPDEPYDELQQELLTAFRLRDVRIVPDGGSDEPLRASLAAGASAWLAEQLQPGTVVGIGLGRTLALMPDTFAVPRPVECRFVTVEGVGASPNAGFAAYNVATRLGDAAGGSAEIISAPTFVFDQSIRDALLSDPAVSASLDRARNADIVIQSVGTVTSNALLFEHGTVTADDLAELRDSGAVGDALGHYFDAAGNHVPWRTDDVHIGLTLEDLRKLPVSALVAGGAEKTAAVRAGIHAGYFNVLITDEATAQRLLERET